MSNIEKQNVRIFQLPNDSIDFGSPGDLSAIQNHIRKISMCCTFSRYLRYVLNPLGK